ncbi:PREDICTED: aluminum-activated malate transporter 12-like isoform X2 [Camelina sativa]|uniref:Aluminum-activated malate transporter 12-like isoform X1 n=1 Tax=Camelina sativa TaxID=90675 RepID=A0ABM0U1U0_CAMSA|nr:PREDICTED: aluminum-activated malate transporter 12-like isoform X1 [Camelina sativa]XP_010434595.1 PREDICTED: aluminum-activated malate transporter 12-like isoform X2 [Camelina sativa]
MSNKVHVGSVEMEEGLSKTKWMVLEPSEKIKKIPKRLWRVGKDDPRRVIHALKVGLSLTLVSLLYLMEPLFKGVGSNAIWAVMTVVVVLEFSAGATLCKGLNRGLGTLIAGSLAFFIEFVANDSGKVLRAIFIGTAVFIIGAVATYIRFIPYIKKNYDYGVVIFLLTFNLITVSSYRVDSVITIAHDRFYTIAVGCGICLFMSLLVFPIWSGEDLHKTTVGKLQGLSRSIEACVNEYFEEKETEKETSDSKDRIYEGYQAVLDSKSTDETLALYANWEPRHSLRCHRFPCRQYVKVGAVLRQFGYTVVALHGCLQTEIQTPRSVRALFKDPCVRLAGEVCKALTELADSISNHRHCSPEILSDHLHVALQDLNSAIKSQPKLFLGSNLHRHNNKQQHANNKHPNGTVSQRNISSIGKDRNGDVSFNETGTRSKVTESGLRHGQNGAVSLSSFRTDTSALMEYRRSFKNSSEMAAAAGERRMLRPQLSKIAVLKSLKFSEALPFAAFASLLVEMVARLDNVIEEVEELGRIASFKEYDNTRDPTAEDVRCEKPANVTISVSAAE